MPQQTAPGARMLTCRAPRLADAPQVHALVAACPPLDLNSPYAYMLLCTHFADTCAVADLDGRPVGFASAYLKPAEPTTLFVWQIAVGEPARGQGVGRRLLEALLDRPACRNVRHVETTITPSNEASWALFRSLARDRRAACDRRTLFHREHFGGADHEEEQLLRIGPI